MGKAVIVKVFVGSLLGFAAAVVIFAVAALSALGARALMTPLLTFCIDRAGWQATLLGFAAAFTLVTVPAALFVIREEAPAGTDLLPEQIDEMPGGRAGAQAQAHAGLNLCQRHGGGLSL